MAELSYGEELTVLIEDPADCAEVEALLARRLLEGGYVRESFAQAIAEREAVYPTGLDAGGINVAMPHCDVEHVVRGAICVGVLGHPVSWHRMDDAQATCEVSLVIMLAINEAHAHLEMLQKVVALIQDQELMGKIVASATPAEAHALIAPRLA